jgi:hypothetical protein
MIDEEGLRARLRAAGAELPDELLALIVPMLRPLLETFDGLAALDLGDTEPFFPAQRLVDDAAR